MIIANIKKNKGDKSFYHISVFTINKFFKLNNCDLNKILDYFSKENQQKLAGKEIIKNYTENELKIKDGGFILKFTFPLNIIKYIKDLSNKKILSKFYQIYKINAYIINEVKIAISMFSLNKSFNLNLAKLIGTKYKENNMNVFADKENNIPNLANNNFNDPKMLFLFFIKYFYFFIIEKNNFINKIQNIEDFNFRSHNKKKFENLEISKNNLNFSLNKKKRIFKIEKSEFKIYGENISFPELIDIKPKGIINRNGSCYLNAAMQCFYHCPKITSYFTLNKDIIHQKGGPISLGYLEVIEEFSNNKKNYISINKFRNLLIENEENFTGNDGNDSKDVILFLLYTIQNELGGEEPDLNLDIDITKEHLLFQDLLENNKIINSIIIENFCFCEKKINKCYVCGQEYFTLTNQYFITFNLKNIYENSKKKLNETISIEECLTYNCFEEADLQIKCHKCNKFQNSLTTISFATIPYYLFIILNRGKNEEFECNFEFKEEIDLSDLYYPVVDEQREKDLKYSLIAGTILHGDHGSGHTFSFAKHFDGNLYLFNDTKVEKTTFENIKNEKVYLLFYQRNNNIKEKKN